MVSEEQLEDIFASGGLLEKSIEGYERRDDQLSMAKDVMRCYNEGAIGVIEAGTGIGKSYAYLSVAMLEAMEDKDERTVVATSNVALQTQLVNKDIPRLLEAIGGRVSYCLLLGRGRYLCLRKLLEAVNSRRAQEEDELFKGDSNEEAIYAWAQSTMTGILDELKPSLLAQPLVRMIASQKESCLRMKCPNFTSCFYYNALARAKQSSLIVTNHSLLFADSSIRAKSGEDYDEAVVIPPYGHLIIDECHNIDEKATDFFSVRIDAQAIQDSYVSLFQAVQKDHDNMRLADIITNLNKEVSLDEAGAFASLAGSFGRQMEDFLAMCICDEDRRRFSSQCLVGETAFDFDRVLSPHLGRCRQALEDFLRVFTSILNIPSGAIGEEDRRWIDMAEGIRRTYIDWYNLLSSFLTWREHEDLVLHYRWKRTGEVAMVMSPLSVADRLWTDLFSKLESVVCTSATVKAGKDFSHFLRQTGLDKAENLVTGFYASPFDYASNALMLYPARGGMAFSARGGEGAREAYADYLARLIVPAIEASGGAALVLFTSYGMMDLVLSKIGEDGIKQRLLVHTKKASTEKLRKDFLEDRDSVLFAQRSFWEGIDVPGDALRLLIVTQLPFTHVEDCIRKARAADLERRGENAFMLINMPDMVIRMKQGLGRLIRSQSDRGVVLIADERMRRFKEAILPSLPPYYVPDEEGLTVDSFPRRIEDFLYN